MRTLVEMLTLANVLTWAKTKDPAETFNYGDNTGCAIAQYIKDEGYDPSDVSVGGSHVSHPGYVTFPRGLEDVLDATIIASANVRYIPYGRLVEHLEAQMASAATEE